MLSNKAAVDAFIRSMESTPRHDDEKFHWSLEEWAERTQNVYSGLPVEQIKRHANQLPADWLAELPNKDPDDDVWRAWKTARTAAIAYLHSSGRADLAEVVEERCLLAISHRDKWFISREVCGNKYVICCDQGLVGVLQRLSRFVAMYFKWDATLPGRAQGYEDLFPADAMERLFRVYFRNARFGGVLCTRDLVFNPPSGLVHILPGLALTFIMLHEISHVIVAYDPEYLIGDLDEEVVCDIIAAKILTVIPVSDPGLRALAVRLFFAMQRAIDDAVFMIPPSTHPSARERERETLLHINAVSGYTGELGWSRMIFTPINALIDMASLSPAWVDMDTKLDAVYDWASPHFEIIRGPGHDHARRMINFQEDIDCGIHQPPSIMASFLIERINMCLNTDGYDMSGCPPMLLNLVRGQTPSESLGWAFIDKFIELHRSEIDAFRNKVPQLGLRYCDYYWFQPGRNWGHLLDYFIWVLVHTRLGWLNHWKTGVRAWGRDANNQAPREMTDMDWVMKFGHLRDVP